MARMTWKVLSCLILLLVVALPGYVQAQGNITYVYDDLGRLVGVIDAAGNAAVYKYDAVGNLLSITRYISTQLSIIAFTPTSGPVGTTVTIQGTGFSATPSQNTVRFFNGVTATVTSASGTQIVTTVPTGATTGPISVTVGGVTATSDTPFTVRDASGAPTITGFTPTIGTPVPPTPVTITGTGFDTNIANDRTRFNITLAAVTSATATTIATSVPSAMTSGHISVTTPAGKGVSSADFFVPPPPYGVAAVGFTGRMAIGTSRTFALNTAGNIGLMLFDGTAGQRVLATASGGFGSCGLLASVLGPYGATVADQVCWPGDLLQTPALPFTATYTILLEPRGTATGTATLTLYNPPPDVTSDIVPGGPPVTLTITTPGQNARVTFTGRAGQRISLAVDTPTATRRDVTIYNPDGTILVPPTFLGPGPSRFLDTQTLPMDVIYTIVVHPGDAVTGSETLTLYDVPPDFTGTIDPGGPSVPVHISVAGQNARLTFSLATPKRVSLLVTLTGGFTGSFAYIFDASGSRLGITNFGFLDTLPLTPGTYTVLFDPLGRSTGDATLTLYDVLPDDTGTINIGDPPPGREVRITVPGQNGQLTFQASAGQQVTVHLTNNGIGSVRVTLVLPDRAMSSVTSDAISFDLPSRTPLTGGTCTVLIDPPGPGIGSIYVRATSP